MGLNFSGDLDSFDEQFQDCLDISIINVVVVIVICFYWNFIELIVGVHEVVRNDTGISRTF